jgi:hypothetical protein
VRVGIGGHGPDRRQHAIARAQVFSPPLKRTAYTTRVTLSLSFLPDAPFDGYKAQIYNRDNDQGRYNSGQQTAMTEIHDQFETILILDFGSQVPVACRLPHLPFFDEW